MNSLVKTIVRIIALISIISLLTLETRVYAQERSTLEFTHKTFSEKGDLNRIVRKEFGENYSIADWNDLKSIRNIERWIESAHLKDGWTFIVTKDRKSMVNGNRQYFVYYSARGTTPPNFQHNGVYDKIGNKLYLGAWYNLDAHILVIKNSRDDVRRNDHDNRDSDFNRKRRNDDCESLYITTRSYSEKDNLNREVTKELGRNFTIADWSDIKSIRNINAWIDCMGLVKGQTFMITKNGEYKNGNTRQYFVLFSPGGAPSGFLVHDKIYNKLFLGSWYGENRNILAKKNR